MAAITTDIATALLRKAVPMQARIRVCCCCGDSFEVYPHEDRDKCGHCQGQSRLELIRRQDEMRRQLAMERRVQRGDDDRD